MRRDDPLNAPGAGDRGSPGRPPAADPPRGGGRPDGPPGLRPPGLPARAPDAAPGRGPAPGRARGDAPAPALPRASEVARRIRVVPGAGPAASPADAALARQALTAADRGDWETVQRLGRAHASRIDLTDPAVWPAILSSVPRSVLRERPALAFSEALVASLARGSVHVARERLDPVRALADGAPAPATSSGILAFFPRIEGERLWGRLDAALAHAEALRELVIARSEEESVQDLAPGAFILLGTTLLLMGRYDDALRALHDAERSARWTAHPAARFAEAYLALGRLLADSPDLADRGVASAPTRRTAPPGSWTFVYESATLFAPVLRALADADRDAARDALAEIDEQAERSPFGWLASHARARVALLWGAPGPALVETRRALVNLGASAGPGTLARSVLNADLADLALALGRFDEAVSAAFDRDSTAPFGLLDAARARLDPASADDVRDGEPGLARDAAGRRARAAVARIDASEIGPARSRALVEAARTVQEARAAAAVVETSRASRATLWPLLGRSPGDCPVADFARTSRRHLDLLTPREREVLLALDAAVPLKQVSARLAVSENTLKTHLRSIYRKLGVSSRRELAELLRREPPPTGAVEPAEPPARPPAP